ncbi:MAG: hypothetical protein SWY16_00015 [Cyanobacteriota bacterium]|nr:hypothetical protein [Cyanobacteriota bacterium]
MHLLAMLYFILVWLGLLVTCSILGRGLLAVLSSYDFDDTGDRFIASNWIGVVVLCVVLLATSSILPLSSWVGFFVCAALIAAALSMPRVRVDLANAIASVNFRSIAIFAVLTVAVAALASQQIWWFDTGLYHLGSIQWLSEFGAVPGVALVNPKFGFVSSWFAFAAPLTPEFLGDRVGAISNGFIFLLAAVQATIALGKIVAGRARVPDWFLLIFFAIAISIYLVSVPASPILISFSADVAVTSLVGMTGWAILVTSSTQKLPTSPEPDTGSRATVLDARLVPLILACGAVTIKLTALPLLPVTVGFYVLSGKMKLRRIGWAIALTVVLLAPMFLYGILASGCPLFPSELFCLDVPWRASEQRTEVTANEVRFWWQYAQDNQSILPDFLIVFWAWLMESKKSQLMVVLLAISFPMSWRILKTSKFVQLSGKIAAIALGFLGMAFILTQSPLIRFGLGYFLTIPALWSANWARRNLNPLKVRLENRVPLFEVLFGKAIVVFAILFALCAIALAKPGNIPNRLLLPARLPNVELENEPANGIEFLHPIDSIQCWRAELPCTHFSIDPDITLRKPESGLGGGFIIKDE